MNSINTLYYGEEGSGHSLRYIEGIHRRPVTVFNLTRSCNLNCRHCYANASPTPYPDELTHEEAESVIKDLADYNIPALLFTGGEPLLRKDLFELAKLAHDHGIRTTLSTNGTLINQGNAERLRKAEFSYIGVSLDGVGSVNDSFRGRKGAFEDALQGIRNGGKEGLKMGLRFTLTQHNLNQVPMIFNLASKEGISRICFYHLVYSGRGREIMNQAPSHDQTRRVIDSIIDATGKYREATPSSEVLTVDNHADGVYIYLKLLREKNSRVSIVRQLLERNGGNSSGVGIGCIDSRGFVHPDQFWNNINLGNIRNRRFSEIWSDSSDPLLSALRNRHRFLKGRCSTCRFLNICNGNFRARAEVAYGDIWAPDPACYLNDGEITQA